uniref:Uncharacterized protein n=1 Tax=viral metagenome TaxID=1070528 RepID=A0A6C0HC76_9ZZZZ
MNRYILNLTRLSTLGPSDVGKLYYIIQKDSGTKTPMEYVGDTVGVDGQLFKSFTQVRSDQNIYAEINLPQPIYHYNPDDSSFDLYETNLPKDALINISSYVKYRGGKFHNKRAYKKYTRKNKKVTKKRKSEKRVNYKKI